MFENVSVTALRLVVLIPYSVRWLNLQHSCTQQSCLHYARHIRRSSAVIIDASDAGQILRHALGTLPALQ